MAKADAKCAHCGELIEKLITPINDTDAVFVIENNTVTQYACVCGGTTSFIIQFRNLDEGEWMNEIAMETAFDASKKMIEDFMAKNPPPNPKAE